MKSATRTANIRISPRAHEMLRQLAEEEQRSMQSVLDQALERYRRERFLRAANADFASLKDDAKAWKQELGERELWEQTVADGISGE
jgi:predicted transcriptional regulator